MPVMLGGSPGRRRSESGATFALAVLERLLQLAGNIVGRGVEAALRDLGGTRQRLVERLVDRRLAHDDQPGVVGRELLRRIMEFLARQFPAPERLGDEADKRAIHPLDNM